MKFGLVVASMGPLSTREVIGACARAAEQAGVDDLWVVDHLAIPKAESEGSGGRYLEQLTLLSWLAGYTERIGLGTSVLVIPYRPPLPTAKQVATIQELSGGRLRLGVGVGWMDSEFRALGVERSERGRLTDEFLEFLSDCFASDHAEHNGQDFLFLPRPERPPIYVGGRAPHALERAARYGDGWMPMGGDPESLRADVERLQELATQQGRGPLEVVPLTSLPLDEPEAARERVAAFAEVGVTRIVHTFRYADPAEFARTAERLGKLAG